MHSTGEAEAAAPDKQAGSAKVQAVPRASSRNQGLLDRSVQAQIGRMLRDVFADIAEEPVPERFVKLLEILEAQEKGR